MLPPAKLAAAALLALALVPQAAAQIELDPASRKQVLRASFEGSLSGWRGYNATLSVVDGRIGERAVRVANTGSASSFSIYPARRPVRASVAGARYVASAHVRSATPGRQVCLRIREWAGTSVAGSANSCLVSASAWKAFPSVAYVARGSRRTLDVYVYEWNARSGDSFDVDAIALVAGQVSEPVAGPRPGSDPVPAPAANPPVAGSAPTVGAATPSSGGTAAAGGTASAGGVSASLTATATDNAHVTLAWPAVAGVTSYRVSRGSLVVGLVQATSFTDSLLWPATSYDYVVDALGAGGATISTRQVSATTMALPAAGFPRPFAPTSFWNTPVGSRATHARNAELSSYFRSKVVNPNLALHRWGVAVAEAQPGSQLHSIPCTRYACTLGAFGGVPMPLTAAPDPAGDGHLAVIDPATNREWGMWQAKLTGGAWTASAGAAVSLAGDGLAPAGTASGNAANFPLLGGLIRPEEILQGRIDHALVFGLPGIGQGSPVCPATHNAPTTSDPNALREGQLLQLDPSLDVDALPLPAWQKTIARAAQAYGMYLRDNSGSLALYAENPVSRGYDAWDKVGLGEIASASLAGFPWDRFRVVSAPDC